MKTRPVIYQTIPRLFTNYNSDLVSDGDISRNGCGKLNGFTLEVLKSIKDLGVTHIWFTGVIEHGHASDYTAYGIAKDNKHLLKGKAGSPYAIKDYYDIDPDLAEDVPSRIKEFDNLVTRTHEAGLKVIIDFVPNHLFRQYHSDSAPEGVKDFGDGDNNDTFFSRDNNFYYFPGRKFSPCINLGEEGDKDYYCEFPAKATGNDCFNATPGAYDWYETVKLNYGIDYRNGYREFDPIPDTWHKMYDVLAYWANKGVDGFRCDMAHMVPVEFWGWVIPRIKKINPDIIFIAEIYDTNLYEQYINQGKFDYLYDKVTLYDTLYSVTKGLRPSSDLTRCWQITERIRPNMLHFLENHDEIRIASRYFAGDPWKALPAWIITSLMTYGPTMIYFGQELGEKGEDVEGFSGFDGRTTIFDYWSVSSVRDWLNNGKCNGGTEEQNLLRKFYKKIAGLSQLDVIANGRFFDLMYVNYENPSLDPTKIYTFLKSTDKETVFVIVNFSDHTSEVKVNIPRHAIEIYNLPEGKVTATNLLDGLKHDVVFASSTPFYATVPAYGAVAYLMKHSKFKHIKS